MAVLCACFSAQLAKAMARFTRKIYLERRRIGKRAEWAFSPFAVPYTAAVRILGKPWLLLLPVFVFVWGVWFFGLTRTLDRAFFDSCTAATAKSLHTPTNGVLVLIDEQSLGEISKRYSAGWPWPRPLFAALIASLHHAGAEKILMDFTFFEQKDQMGDDMLAAYAAACRGTILGRSQIKTPVFWTDEFNKSFPRFAVQSRLGLVDFSPDSDG